MRMKTNGFIKAKKFWTVKIDAPNMRVTTLWGRLGTLGAHRVRFFNDRESLWDYAERKIDEKVDAGYVQIA